MFESIFIIVICLLLLAVIGFMFFSERSVRKKHNQPTIKELNECYKQFKKESSQSVVVATKDFSIEQYFNFRSLQVASAAIVCMIPSIVILISNSGTNPCSINKINVNPKPISGLYMDEERSRSCN